MYPFLVLISQVIYLYSLAVTVWVILSLLIYFRVANRMHPLVAKTDDVLNKIIEPALRPIRRVLPDMGGVDLSPVILLLLLNFLRSALWYYFY